jgi:hypothetical protein
MPAFRSVVTVLLRLVVRTFSTNFKAGPAGGRLRRPPSRRQRHDGHLGSRATILSEWSQSSRQRV